VISSICIKKNILCMGLAAFFLAFYSLASIAGAKSKVPPTEPVLHTIKGKVNIVDHGRVVIDDFSFHLPPGVGGVAPGDQVELTFDNSGKLLSIKKLGSTESIKKATDSKDKIKNEPPEKTPGKHELGTIRKEGGKWKNY